jgi:hypothetical protein
MIIRRTIWRSDRWDASRWAIRCALAFSLGALLWLGSHGSAAQNDQEVRTLETGKPIEARELVGGQSHAYQITLVADQFLHVVVEQRGIDVVVTLVGPDGKQIIEVDSPNGVQGPELVSVVAETEGGYRLEVRSLEKDAVEKLLAVLSAPRGQQTGETLPQQRKRAAELDAKTRTAAAKLSRMLLAPVAAELGKRRLVIVADGALQYVPFAVLPKPGAAAQTRGAKSKHSAGATPLIIDHEIVSLPSASTIAVLRRELAGRQAAPKVFAALADPVFSEDEVDERLNEVARAATPGERQGSHNHRDVRASGDEQSGARFQGQLRDGDQSGTRRISPRALRHARLARRQTS